MRYAILYDSHTGNTAKAAQIIRHALPEEDCLCFLSTIEALKKPEKFADADLILYGFWTDRGNCPEQSQKLLPMLPPVKVALFGTAGFGTDADYFAKIMDNAKQFVPQGATVTGTIMCAGKMPLDTKVQYEKLLKDPASKDQAQALLNCYDAVAGHPTREDLEAIKAFALAQYEAAK